jgi:hypothetical protein
MENNKLKVKEESIEKYYNTLLELRNVLSYTKRISMDAFCVKQQVSRNLAQVLQKGGIIKCLQKGKYSEWEWSTIEPTKHMAVKAIQLLGKANPPRKPQIKKLAETLLQNDKRKTNGGKRVGAGRKTNASKEVKVEEKKSINIKLFFGLISFTINI